MKDRRSIIVSRIYKLRKLGGIIFINIRKNNKEKQCIINLRNYEGKTKEIDKTRIGNICKIAYEKGKNIRGEKRLIIKKIKNISINKHKIPNKHKNIKNKNTIYRRRYLETFNNIDIIKKIIAKQNLINELRKYMKKNKFIEIDCPILNSYECGAEAELFKTYNNSLKKTMNLRISPEIHLKKSIICGFNRVFEIGKVFRNENISKIHYPEFTMFEFYVTNKNNKWMKKFLEKMIVRITKKLKEKKIIKKEIKKGFKTYTVKKYISKFIGKNKINNRKYLIKKIKKRIKPEYIENIYMLRYLFFEQISKHINKPTFIKGIPSEISPLAKKYKNNKEIAQRYELYIKGIEIANGYNEVNKYKEQKKNFLKQQNNEEKKIDKDYIEYMKFGMPKTQGCGIGIERLLMIITESKNIKETIMFPELR